MPWREGAATARHRKDRVMETVNINGMERKAGSCLERMAVRYARKPTSARFEALADAVRRAEGGDAR